MVTSQGTVKSLFSAGTFHRMASGFATALDDFQQIGCCGLKICWHRNHLVSVNTPSPVSWREVYTTPLLNLIVYTKAVVPGGCGCRGQTSGMNAGCTSWDLFVVEDLHSEVIEDYSGFPRYSATRISSPASTTSTGVEVEELNMAHCCRK